MAGWRMFFLLNTWRQKPNFRKSGVALLECKKEGKQFTYEGETVRNMNTSERSETEETKQVTLSSLPGSFSMELIGSFQKPLQRLLNGVRINGRSGEIIKSRAE